MRTSILIAALSMLYCGVSICFGGWTFAKDIDGAEEKISDEKIEFDIGDMKCGADKTLFLRDPDDNITESRLLYCWTSPDTYVATFVTCHLPDYSFQTLMIKKNNKLFQPHLTCGPNTKK